MTDYIVKVSDPDFQLPQVVLDHLPVWLTADEVAFTHVQPTPLAVWDIIHPLTFTPSVTITDSAGTVVYTEIIYVAPNLVRSIAAGAFSGIARLS